MSHHNDYILLKKLEYKVLQIHFFQTNKQTKKKQVSSTITWKEKLMFVGFDVLITKCPLSQNDYRIFGVFLVLRNIIDI